jgi:UPF0755 protein
MKKVAVILVVLCLLIGPAVVSLGYYGYTLLQPLNSHNTEKKRFVITKGESITKIGTELQTSGIIRSALAFRFVTWKEKLGNKIQAGSFLLSPNMSPQQVAEQLTQGTNDVWVTLLEGWRTEEIADALSNSDLEEFDKKEFLNLAKDQEGYLFPDSYLLPRAATTETAYHLLRNTFERKVEKGLDAEIKKSGRSLEDVVTMASIVEREAKGDEQMQMVAGILWKRIDAGMGLNVDATLQYIQGYNPVLKTWWAPPTTDTKASTSAFNTYKFQGLPPHPIANPGLDAIKATLEPTESDYVYYLHDAQGKIHYAKTLDEHNQNVQKYLR